MWLGLLVIDIVVLAMTLAKTHGVARDLRVIPNKMPLATLMLRDGLFLGSFSYVTVH